MKNSIRILGIGMSLILASSCCLASQGATLEKGIDVGNYMTIQTEQKSKRFEISTSKFAEMKQNAKARETSDLALSREIVRQAGLSQGEELVSHQLADHLSEIGNLTYQVQYLKCTSEGTPEAISKEACLREVRLAEQADRKQ